MTTHESDADNAGYAATAPAAEAAVVTRPDPGPIDHEKFFLVKLIDSVLDFAKKGLSERFVMESCRWLAFIGMWAMIVFAALVLIFGLIMATNVKAMEPFWAGLVAALLSLALLYTAGKFCNAGSGIIDSTPSEMSSRRFLDCLALLAGVLSIVSLIGGIVTAVNLGTMVPAGIGFLLAAWWAYLTAAALNPALVNCSIRSGASAGQEFLGILSFFLKAMLRIVPIVFGVAAAIGSVLYAINMIRFLAADEFEKGRIFEDLAAMTGFVLMAAALPLVVYLAVLVVYLLIDIARAILRIK